MHIKNIFRAGYKRRIRLDDSLPISRITLPEGQLLHIICSPPCHPLSDRRARINQAATLCTYFHIFRQLLLIEMSNLISNYIHKLLARLHIFRQSGPRNSSMSLVPLWGSLFPYDLVSNSMPDHSGAHAQCHADRRSTRLHGNPKVSWVQWLGLTSLSPPEEL